MTIEQAIAKTLQIVEGENKSKEILWAVPVVSELNQLDCSLLIRWGGECIKIYLSEFGHPKLDELEKYLKDAIDSGDSYTPSECVDMARKIWYLKGVREEVQTSLSNLWAVIGDCKSGQPSILMASNVVTLLLPKLSNHDLLNRYLNAAVSIHKEYKARCL